jgi:hypothetical protein
LEAVVDQSFGDIVDRDTRHLLEWARVNKAFVRNAVVPTFKQQRIVAGSRETHLSIEIRPVQIDLSAVRMDNVANRPDRGFEDAVG